MDPAPPPRYLQLADALCRGVQDATYRAGQKLPSVRELRAQTRLSVATVCRALRELERRGVAQARARSGYFVLPRRPAPAAPRPAAPSRPKRPQLHRLTESIVAASARADLVPLGGAVVSPDLLPGRHLNRLARQILADDPLILGRYGDARGLLPLRRELARRMPREGGLWSADELVITPGCMGAVQLSLLAVASAGDIVLVESPSFFGHLQVLRDLGMRAVEAPVDPITGIDLDAVQAAARRHRLRAVLVTPNFQNPLGALMPDAHKRRLVELACQHGFALIESDVYGDLHYGGPRPRPLAAFDPEGRVLHCSSMSKTLSAGLRVGWVAPGRHLERVRALALSSGICGPGLNQAILARFLADGSYDRHLVRLRGALERQSDDLAAAVARHFPAPTALTQPRGGFLRWLELDRAVDSQAVYATALRRNIAVMPGAVCSLGGSFNHCLRLSGGYPWTPQAEAAVEFLAAAAKRRG